MNLEVIERLEKVHTNLLKGYAENGKVIKDIVGYLSTSKTLEACDAIALQIKKEIENV